MAVEKPFTPRLYEDFLSSFEAGMSAGVSPLLLQVNQLAFGLNLSIRGGFATHRPPFSKKTLAFNGNFDIQNIVQTGLFQGAGYYRPDYGTESLIAQISGRLFLFTESGSTWNVTEITIPGDPNNATVSQVWMWQSEKWMIIQDGTGKLPIFYDGVTSRRSYGPSVQLGNAITFDPAKPPAIGSIETVTLDAAYTGPFNVPVIFNKEFYQPIQNINGYKVVLTNLTAAPGEVIPTGSSVVVNPAFLAYVTTAFTPNPHLGTNVINSPINGLQVSNNTTGYPPPSSVPDNNSPSQIKISTVSFNDRGSVSVLTNPALNYTGSTAPNFINAQYFGLVTGIASVPALALVSRSFGYGPIFPIGNTNSAFTVPPVGGQITVLLDQPYTGSGGQVVFIGTEAFGISNPPNTPPGTTLFLINLTDNSAANYTIVAPATGLPIVSVPEIPAGRMGAYGLGVNSFSLTDGISYATSDVVGSGAGTPANSYRDAVLKMTQNTFLRGGGSFRLPGTGDLISAVLYPPLLDTSLGQGPLEIGTPFSFFSNAVIGTFPGIWADITSPIQTESLKDNGPLGQNSTVLVNSDTYFRSNIGIGSLLIARRDFGTNSPGNKTISNEIGRILDPDNQALLPYGSAFSFDNRFQCTVSPLTTSAGVCHQGTVSLNFDLLSTMRATVPAAWEGLWTGLNLLQLITGRVNGVRRSFAFSYNFTLNQIELYEMSKEKTTSFADNDTTSILWAFETPVILNKQVKDPNTLVQLRDGEIYLSDIQGAVHVAVYYRPDFYPCWTLWNEFDVCQSTDANNSKSGYRMRVGLGEPSVTPSELGNNRPLRNGYFFQCRIVIIGSCVFKGMRVAAITQPQAVYAPIESMEAPCQLIDCDIPDDFRLYSLQGFPPAVPLPAPPVPQPFSNAQIILNNYCPISVCSLGAGPVATGALPGYIQVDTANNRLIGAAGLFTGVTQTEADAKALAFYTAVAPTLNISCPGVASSLLANLTWTDGSQCSVQFSGTAASPAIRLWYNTAGAGCGVFGDPASKGFYTANFCNNSAASVTIRAALGVFVFGVDPNSFRYQGLKLNGSVMFYTQAANAVTPPGYPPAGKLDGVTTIVCPPGQVTQLVFQADSFGSNFFGQDSGTLAAAIINLTIV